MERSERALSAPPTDWLLFAPGTDVLSALAGMDVRAHLVASSRAFRTALPAERPRVVVLAMPPGGSADLALLARERQRRPAMTAILLSGCAGDGLGVRPIDGAIDVALPLETRGGELVARSAQLLRRRSTMEDPPGIAFSEGTVLHPTLHELWRGDRVMHLRPREHALLLLLARHPGRVFSRREILDGAWGPDHDVDPRTVDVHIRWLRQKVERDPSSPQRLLTVRGAGYRLAAGAPHRRRRATEAGGVNEALTRRKSTDDPTPPR